MGFGAVGSQVKKIDPISSTRNLILLDFINCVKSIDSKDSLERFLSKLLGFYMNDVGVDCEETVFSLLSLLDYLARCRGKFLIPQTTTTIIEVLLDLLSSSSNPSITLQIYCSRVISSVVYSLADPRCCTRKEQNSQAAIAVVSRVLINSLSGKWYSLSVGSAILLRALLATEAWTYASYELVNQISSVIAPLLEKKGTSTPFHLNLVCCLMKRSRCMGATPYIRSMLKSAEQILVNDSGEKRFCAVEMINCILRYVDDNAMLPGVLKCIRVINWLHGFDQSPTIRDICAETIRQFDFSNAMSDHKLGKASLLNEGEKLNCSVSSSRTWVSSYSPFDPHFCIGDCCFRLDTRKTSCLHADKETIQKTDPEPQIYKNMLELVRMTRISKDNYHCSNPKKLVSQPNGRDWISSSSGLSSNLEIRKKTLSKEAKTNGGPVNPIRKRAASHSGKIIGGLFGLGLAASAAMVVWKGLSEATE